MAQHESISRKVIAGVITAGVIAVLGLLAKWLLPGLAHVAATFFLTVWRWCVHLVSVPAWLLILLSLYVGTSLIRAYLRHRSRTRQKTQRPADPDWRDYTCDVFDEIVWRWGYASRGELLQLVPFCFKCDTQIHPEIGHIDALGEKTRYPCDNDNCRNQVLLDGSHEQVVDRVSRQIQRKLRSPSEELKTAIKANAWRNR
jgi:hypothetical protein